MYEDLKRKGYLVEKNQGLKVIAEFSGTSDQVWDNMRIYLQDWPFGGYMTKVVLPPMPDMDAPRSPSHAPKYKAVVERFESCE